MVVWVLIAIAYSGHFTNSIIPTLEFSSQEKCLAAIREFQNDSSGKIGNANGMRCLRIEK